MWWHYRREFGPSYQSALRQAQENSVASWACRELSSAAAEGCSVPRTSVAAFAQWLRSPGPAFQPRRRRLPSLGLCSARAIPNHCKDKPARIADHLSERRGSSRRHRSSCVAIHQDVAASEVRMHEVIAGQLIRTTLTNVSDLRHDPPRPSVVTLNLVARIRRATRLRCSWSLETPGWLTSRPTNFSFSATMTPTVCTSTFPTGLPDSRS